MSQVLVDKIAFTSKLPGVVVCGDLLMNARYTTNLRKNHVETTVAADKGQTIVHDGLV